MKLCVKHVLPWPDPFWISDGHIFITKNTLNQIWYQTVGAPISAADNVAGSCRSYKRAVLLFIICGIKKRFSIGINYYLRRRFASTIRIVTPQMVFFFEGVTGIVIFINFVGCDYNYAFCRTSFSYRLK